eukprot:83419-Amphidinium_carterae.1
MRAKLSTKMRPDTNCVLLDWQSSGSHAVNLSLMGHGSMCTRRFILRLCLSYAGAGHSHEECEDRTRLYAR